MNIFVLDNNPILAARYHCDKHCGKKIYESAQLLSMAHRMCPNPNKKVNQLLDSKIYKTAEDPNGACAVWVRSSIYNYLWLLQMSLELNREYIRRYRHIHKSNVVIQWCRFWLPNIPLTPQTPFALRVPEYCKVPLAGANDETEPQYAITSEGKLVDNSTENTEYFYDVVESYRTFYRACKAQYAKWDKLSNEPLWFANC